MDYNELFKSEFNKLNESQKQAVESIYGPIMVVAGPGTGKTQIIALRTANIIKLAGINPENILISTFTDAGVISIRKRLVKFLGQDGYKVKVSTFHAFASEVISDFPENFLEQRAKQAIDDIESYEILSSLLDNYIKNGEIKELFNSMDRFAYLRDIKDRIGKLKTEGISPDDFALIIEKQNKDYEEKLEDLKNNKRIKDLERRRKKDKENYDKHINKLKELNLIYKGYNYEIREKGLYDFADMINFVTDKFKNDEEIIAYYAEKFQFIMIDEFQDTNNSQNQVVNLILDYFPEEQNIMVVGDDDQSIYRFQGANIENMLDFVNKYPDTKHIVLDKNYRSSQDILNLSQNLIENNSQRISNRLKNLNKNLTAAGNYKDLKQNNFFILQNDLKEKEFVYRKIEKNNSADLSFAIILKTNKQVEEWSAFFNTKGLKVNSKNSSNILKNIYCNFLLDLLKLVENPYFDDTSLLNLLRSDLIDIENIDLIYLARSLYQKNYSRNKFRLGLWDIIKDIESDEYILDKLKNLEKILDFKDLVLELNSSLGNSGITGVLRDILKKLDIFEYIEKNGTFDDLQDIFTLVNKIKSYTEGKDANLSNILNKFELYKKFGVNISRESIKSSKANIEILTAHSSKGLEYDYVFIPEVYEGNWNKKALPDKLKLPIGIIGNGLQYSDLDEKEYKNLEKEISLEEERRLFFVAITRAKRSIIFSLAGSKENKLLLKSSFMEEVGIDHEEMDLEINDTDLKEIMISSTLETQLIKTSPDEIEYIAKFLENYKLSPTDLNKFIEDPKKFLREVIFRYPFLSNENLVFGSAYHKILELFAISKSKNNMLSLEKLKNLFIEEINKYDLTVEEHERLKLRGINGLNGYYDIIIRSNREVIATEYNFRGKNIVFDNIPLTGKIDKIEITNSISNKIEQKNLGQVALFKENVALVDYKTGSIKSEGKIKGLDRYGNKKAGEGAYLRQLLFYKLMFENNQELNSKYNIAELALDFVEGKNAEYKYTSVDYSLEDYENFKNELKDAWKKINDLEFWKDLLNN